MTELLSDRVRLIAASIAMLDAEDLSSGALAELLLLPPPPAWPPEHNGPETRDWVRQQLMERPGDREWYSYYVVSPENELIGIVGYKGPPNSEGQVEIGYSILPANQRRGIATEATRLLCDNAFTDPRVTAVIAQTLPALAASQAVLLKSGFARDGEFQDPVAGAIWQYRLDREMRRS